MDTDTVRDRTPVVAAAPWTVTGTRSGVPAGAVPSRARPGAKRTTLREAPSGGRRRPR
ncbi:hypothetical protein O1L60_06150 [Streptomyces diastatochromogenes]|nr:hypothetical protein [Streptomyces diastatochromogenes]